MKVSKGVLPATDVSAITLSALPTIFICSSGTFLITLSFRQLPLENDRRTGDQRVQVESFLDGKVCMSRPTASRAILGTTKAKILPPTLAPSSASSRPSNAGVASLSPCGQHRRPAGGRSRWLARQIHMSPAL